MIIQIKKKLMFLLNPKSYVKNLIQAAIINRDKERNEWDLEVPITQTDENDIFIIGYPKSGNTWMQSIISGLLLACDTNYLPEPLAQEIVPDIHARMFYKRFGKVNFFKSHELPKPHHKRVIYLVRDGRDVLVSYFNYLKINNNDVSFEDMIYLGKGLYPCKWHIHLDSWMKNPYKADMLIVRYEDLIASPQTELEKLCVFAGIERDNSIIEKVINGTRIDKMRDRVMQSGGMGHVSLRGEKGVKFFRKGKIGSYKEEFDERLLSYFVQESKVQLINFKYYIDND